MILGAIKRALYKLLTEGGSPPTGGNVFHDRVPEGATPPWTRYSIPDQIDEGSFHSNTPHHSMAVITVDVVSSATTSLEAEESAQRVVDRLDGAILTEPGSPWAGKIKRMPGMRMLYDEKERLWTIGVDYRLLPHTMPISEESE